MVLNINEHEFEKEVLKSKIPVIADFWANWCGPCQMMIPVFEKLSKTYEGKLKFIKINTEDNMRLASQNNVSGIPCLIIFNKGKEIDRIVGFSPESVLKEQIDSIIEKI